jgi:hypothetical protein
MMYRQKKSSMKRRSWVEVRNLEQKSLMKRRSWVEVRNLEQKSLILKNWVLKSLLKV